MSAAHTPGPWAPFVLDRPLDEIPAYVERCIKASPSSDFLIVMAGHEDGGEVDVCHVGNGARGEANARLIAAAPELLEALQALVGLARRGAAPLGDYKAALRVADEAITKAVGSAS